MLDHGATAWATGGCLRYIYMASARDQGCEYGNQLYFSFGLDDRYLILIVTKSYRVLQEPVTLTVSLTRNLLIILWPIQKR